MHKLTSFLSRGWKKSHRYIVIIAGLSLIIFLISIYSYSPYKHGLINSEKDYFNGFLKSRGLKIPENIDFCGEKVPLNDYSVIESLDRELTVNTYWQSQTILLMKRAKRCFEIIEPILKRNNIPDDCKYIAVIESGLTNVVSPAKAAGYWQFMEETGRSYGLEINDEIDERYNLEKSTEAACKYLKESYSKFKNWTLVSASYNMGISGIAAQLEKQRVDSYYDLYLNTETSRYVFRLLAFKDILSNPKNYGFFIPNKDYYPTIPIKKLTVNSSINDLATFASLHGVNYNTLKLLNPWLRSASLLNPDEKTYHIDFPKDVNKMLSSPEYSNAYSSTSDSLFITSKPEMATDTLTSKEKE